MNFKRIIRHLLIPLRSVRRVVDGETLRAVEEAIRAGESSHRGEVRVAVEAALSPAAVWRGQSARERAVEVFSELRVWDTAENNGVLIYLLLADRDVEIVADRGLLPHVDADAWSAICRAMEDAFRRGDFRAGLLDGIRAIHAHLARAYPARGETPNELPDAPTILR